MARQGTLTRSVADRLREEIRAGKWSADERLPSERALAVAFEMSRMTARRCLQMLCREGMVVARPGRGYFPVCGAVGPEVLQKRRSILYYYASTVGRPRLDSLHASIINGANAQADRQGLHLYAVSRPPADFIRTLREGWNDGLRGVLLDWATSDLAEDLIQRGVPCMFRETSRWPSGETRVWTRRPSRRLG